MEWIKVLPIIFLRVAGLMLATIVLIAAALFFGFIGPSDEERAQTELLREQTAYKTAVKEENARLRQEGFRKLVDLRSSIDDFDATLRVLLTSSSSDRQVERLTSRSDLVSIDAVSEKERELRDASVVDTATFQEIGRWADRALNRYSERLDALREFGIEPRHYSRKASEASSLFSQKQPAIPPSYSSEEPETSVLPNMETQVEKYIREETKSLRRAVFLSGLFETKRNKLLNPQSDEYQAIVNAGEGERLSKALTHQGLISREKLLDFQRALVASPKEVDLGEARKLGDEASAQYTARLEEVEKLLNEFRRRKKEK